MFAKPRHGDKQRRHATLLATLIVKMIIFLTVFQKLRYDEFSNEPPSGSQRTYSGSDGRGNDKQAVGKRRSVPIFGMS
jgi:hypothetical protein